MTSKGTKGKNRKPLETTLGKGSTQAEKELDLSHLQKPINTSIFGLKEVLSLLETATEEVKNYVNYECDIMYECRMCRTIFRSLANFILHKRSYCQDRFCVLNIIGDNAVEDNVSAVENEVCDNVECKTPEPNHEPIKETKKSISPIIERLLEKQNVSQLAQKALNEDLSINVANESKIEKSKAKEDILLEKIETNNSAVFQTILNNIKEVQTVSEFMKCEVMEIHGILDSDEAVIGPDGKICTFETNKINEKPNIPKGSWYCPECDLKFSTKKTLTYHIKYKHNVTKIVFICPDCKDSFANAWCVYRHLYKVHRKTTAQIRKMRDLIHCTTVRRDQQPPKKKDKKQIVQENTDDENQWLNNVEGDNDLQMCGGCGKRFERKAALHSHSQMCVKRIAVCNTIKENNAKKKESDEKDQKPKNVKIEKSTFEVLKGASKRKPYKLRTYKSPKKSRIELDNSNQDTVLLNNNLPVINVFNKENTALVFGERLTESGRDATVESNKIDSTNDLDSRRSSIGDNEESAKEVDELENIELKLYDDESKSEQSQLISQSSNETSESMQNKSEGLITLGSPPHLLNKNDEDPLKLEEVPNIENETCIEMMPPHSEEQNLETLSSANPRPFTYSEDDKFSNSPQLSHKDSKRLESLDAESMLNINGASNDSMPNKEIDIIVDGDSGIVSENRIVFEEDVSSPIIDEESEKEVRYGIEDNQINKSPLIGKNFISGSVCDEIEDCPEEDVYFVSCYENINEEESDGKEFGSLDLQDASIPPSPSRMIQVECMADENSDEMMPDLNLKDVNVNNEEAMINESTGSRASSVNRPQIPMISEPAEITFSPTSPSSSTSKYQRKRENSIDFPILEISDHESTVEYVDDNFIKRASPYMDQEQLACVSCEVSFTSLSELLWHMSAHFSWFQFQCGRCSFVSFNKMNCYLHAESEHCTTMENIVLPIPYWKTVLMSHDFHILEETTCLPGKHTDEIIAVTPETEEYYEEFIVNSDCTYEIEPDNLFIDNSCTDSVECDEITIESRNSKPDENIDITESNCETFQIEPHDIYVLDESEIINGITNADSSEVRQNSEPSEIEIIDVDETSNDYFVPKEVDPLEISLQTLEINMLSDQENNFIEQVDYVSEEERQENDVLSCETVLVEMIPDSTIIIKEEKVENKAIDRFVHNKLPSIENFKMRPSRNRTKSIKTLHNDFVYDMSRVVKSNDATKTKNLNLSKLKKSSSTVKNKEILTKQSQTFYSQKKSFNIKELSE